jgi:hypothetical protein
MRFVLDFQAEREIPLEGVSEESRELLREVLERADASFWRQLAWLFYREKYRISDSFEVFDTDFELPIVKKSSMIMYNKVVPHAEYLQCKVNGRKFIIGDWYCPDPSCPHERVSVEFGIDSESRGSGVCPKIVIDLKNLTFESKEKEYVGENLAKSVFNNSRLMSRMRKRHATIRKLYARLICNSIAN